MRGRYNERGDFLMSTVFPVDESQPSPSTLVFPHLGYGGGLNTQFVVYNQTSATFFSGNLRFFSQSGDALNIRLNSNQ